MSFWFYETNDNGNDEDHRTDYVNWEYPLPRKGDELYIPNDTIKDFFGIDNKDVNGEYLFAGAYIVNGTLWEFDSEGAKVEIWLNPN